MKDKDKLEVQEHKILGLVFELREFVNKSELSDDSKVQIIELVDETKEVIKTNFLIEHYRNNNNQKRKIVNSEV